MLGLVQTTCNTLYAPPIPSHTVLLLRAQKLLQQGWGQGTYYQTGRNGVVRYCVLGALWAVTGGDRKRFNELTDIFARANAIEGDTVVIRQNRIAWWNDAWYRTRWSVQRAMNRAIRAA